MSRRWWFAVVALSLGGVSVSACSSSPDSAASQLQERIGDPQAQSDFVMTYRSSGTTVLDCVLPNRTFVISVVGNVLDVTSSTPSASLLATRTAGDLLLTAGLFEQGPLAEQSLSVDLERASAPDLARLRALLGPDLASYLLVVEMPPSGEQIADAALEAATSVEALPSEEINERPAQGYRLQLDPREYREAGASTSRPPAENALAPTIDIWLDGDDAVARVTVTPAAGADTSGWVIDFDDPPDGRPGSQTGASVPVDEVDLQQLRPTTSDCELGS